MNHGGSQRDSGPIVNGYDLDNTLLIEGPANRPPGDKESGVTCNAMYSNNVRLNSVQGIACGLPSTTYYPAFYVYHEDRRLYQCLKMTSGNVGGVQ